MKLLGFSIEPFVNGVVHCTCISINVTSNSHKTFTNGVVLKIEYIEHVISISVTKSSHIFFTNGTVFKIEYIVHVRAQMLLQSQTKLHHKNGK